MRKTIKEIAEIQKALSSIDLSQNDKLTYAVKKINTSIEQGMKPIMNELKEKMQDIEATYAATGEKGILLLDDKGNYQYTAESTKKVVKRKQEIFDDFEMKEVEFEPFLSPVCERLLEIDLYSQELLSGILIDPEILLQNA